MQTLTSTELITLAVLAGDRILPSPDTLKALESLKGNAYWVGRLILDVDVQLPSMPPSKCEVGRQIRQTAFQLREMVQLDSRKFLVNVSYAGSRTYAVRAGTTEEAEEKARQLWDSETPSCTPASDSEKITSFVTQLK